MTEPDSPVVSIVTPCLNMARYLEQTIQSVLTQDYPRIDYIVIDGGSTDGTLEILRKYEHRLRYLSQPDRGTADAINRGFRLSRGSVFAFLNADDFYLPGAVAKAVGYLLAETDMAGVYGEACWVDESGRIIGSYPTEHFDPEKLSRECFICQPAAFFRRSAFEAVGMMNPELQFAFDYDLWIRIARRFPMRKLDERLAASRMHRENKTLGSRRRVFEETMRMLRSYYSYIPFQWVHGYCCYLVDRRDQFFEPLRPSLLKYALSLPFGLYHNRRRPWRYWKEWWSVMSLEGLERRWSESWLRRAFQLHQR